MAENELTELLNSFTQPQIEFVAARLSARSDKEAAEAIGIAASTVYCWPNKSDIDRAVALAAMGSLELVRERLVRLALKAVGVLETEMDGEKRRLDAARDVLDRIGIIARRELDVTSGGQPLATVIVIPDNERDKSPGETK